MSLGWPQILLVAVLVLLLFGRGKIADLMGDIAKGVRNFRKGLNEDDDPLPDTKPDTKPRDNTPTP